LLKPALRGRTEKNHEQLDIIAGAGARIVTVHTSNDKQKCCPLQRDRSERRRGEERKLDYRLPEQEGSFDEAMV